MAEAKITDLTELTSPELDDVLYIVDFDLDISKKITYGNLVGSGVSSLFSQLNTLSTKVDSISTTQASISNSLNIIQASTDKIDIAFDSFSVNTGTFFTSAFSLQSNINTIDSNTNIIGTFNTPTGLGGLNIVVNALSSSETNNIELYAYNNTGSTIHVPNPELSLQFFF